MKKLAFLILLAVAALISSCGTRTTPPTTTTTASGSWEAVLTGGTGDASQLNFVVQFDVTNTNGGSSQPLSISGFSFYNSNACFVSGQTIAGSANLGTSNSNQVTGSMNLTATSGVPSGNVLTLTSTALSGTASGGKLTSGAVAGTWTLAGGQGDPSCCVGPTCTASDQKTPGTFTLCQNATNCTVTF